MTDGAYKELPLYDMSSLQMLLHKTMNDEGGSLAITVSNGQTLSYDISNVSSMVFTFQEAPAPVEVPEITHVNEEE